MPFNKTDLLCADLKQLYSVKSISIDDTEKIKHTLQTPKEAQRYAEIIARGGKPETALSDYIFKPLLEDDEYLNLRIAPQIRAGEGWVDYLIHSPAGSPPVAIELKPLHEMRFNTIKIKSLDQAYEKMQQEEDNQIKQYLRDHDYVILTNMQDIYYFNREAIFTFQPFLRESFLTFVDDLRTNNDIWDVVRRKEDITPRSDLDRRFFLDLKRWYAEFAEVEFIEGTHKADTIVRLINKFIFLKTLEDHNLIPFNFTRETYEDKRKRWSAKGKKKVFSEFFEELNQWCYAFYDTELFRESTIDLIDQSSNNLDKLQIATEKILGLSDWAKTFGIGLIHYNYRSIDEDVFGKTYETFLAEDRKAHGIFYTPKEITEYMSNTLVESLFGPLVHDFLEANKLGDYENAANLAKKICDIKIIDPACGSGSFLIKVLRHIWLIYKELNKETEWATAKAAMFEPDNIRIPKEKTMDIRELLGIGRESFDARRTIALIILRHLYGIDLDEKAIDVAKVNIWKEAIKLAPRDFRYSSLPEKIHHILPDLEINLVIGNSIVDLPFEECQQLIRTHFKKDIIGLHGMRDSYLSDPYSPELIANISTVKNKIRAYLTAYFNGKGYAVDTYPIFLPLEFFFLFFDGNGDALASGEYGFGGVIGNPPWENIKPVSKEFASLYPEIFGQISKFSMEGRDFDKAFQQALKQYPIFAQAWDLYSRKIAEMSRYVRDSYQLYGGSGDLSYQKLFLERGLDIVKNDGNVSMLVTSGFHTDEGWKDLRLEIVNNQTLHTLMSFENRGNKWFHDVDSRFKFDAVMFRKTPGKGVAIQTRFYINDITDTNTPFMQKPVDINKISPNNFGFVEFRTATDQQLIYKIRNEHALLKDVGAWLLSEFHMTNDNGLFDDKQAKKSLPLYEGKMIHQYESDYDTPRYWIKETDGRKRMLSKEIYRIRRTMKDNGINSDFSGDEFASRGFKLDYESFRLCHRAVASSTNERTLIAMILPPNVFTVHSLNVFKAYSYEYQGGQIIQRQMDYRKMLFLLVLLNSFVLDYYTRLRVSANLTTFFIYELPIPQVEPALQDNVIQKGLDLLPELEVYQHLSKSIGHEKQTLSIDDKRTLRAQLEAIIARDIYRLTKIDMEYILKTFVFGGIDTALTAEIIDHF